MFVYLSAQRAILQKVDIHEIEERKNLHINDLMRNHEKAFGQMKAYYNDITNDNLKVRDVTGFGAVGTTYTTLSASSVSMPKFFVCFCSARRVLIHPNVPEARMAEPAFDV